MTENAFYVYVHFRPWNGTPCYVGKGKGRRWLVHESYGADHYNEHLARIFAKAGGRLPKIKVRENLTETEALATEVALIAAIGRGKNGPLVNMTDGGEGVTGFVGRVKSPEECAAISRGKMGHAVDAATREKISRANAAYYATNPMTEEQKRATSIAVKSSPKTKARIVPVPPAAIEEALSGSASIVAVAKKYGVGRRLLNERVLAMRRAA